MDELSTLTGTGQVALLLAASVLVCASVVATGRWLARDGRLRTEAEWQRLLDERDHALVSAQVAAQRADQLHAALAQVTAELARQNGVGHLLQTSTAAGSVRRRHLSLV